MYFCVGTVVSATPMYVVLDTGTSDIDIITETEYKECLKLGFTIIKASKLFVLREYKKDITRIMAKRVDMLGSKFIISFARTTASFATLDFSIGLETLLYSFNEFAQELILCRHIKYSDNILCKKLDNIFDPISMKASGNSIYALRTMEYCDGEKLVKCDINRARKKGMSFDSKMSNIHVNSIKVQMLHNNSFLVAVTISSEIKGTLDSGQSTKQVTNYYSRQFYYLYDRRTNAFTECLLALDSTILGSDEYYGWNRGTLVTLPRVSSNWVLTRVMLNKSYLKASRNSAEIGELVDGLHLILIGEKKPFTLLPSGSIDSLTEEDIKYWDRL